MKPIDLSSFRGSSSAPQQERDDTQPQEENEVDEQEEGKESEPERAEKKKESGDYRNRPTPELTYFTRLPAAGIFVGGPGNGKTALIKFLLHEMAKKGMIDKLVLFTHDKDYTTIAKNCVVKTFSNDYLTQILEEQDPDQYDDEDPPHCVMVFDDSTINWQKQFDAKGSDTNTPASTMFKEHRHKNITILAAGQFTGMFKGDMAQCVTNAGIFYTDQRNQRQSIFTHWGGNLTRAEFDKLLMQVKPTPGSATKGSQKGAPGKEEQGEDNFRKKSKESPATGLKVLWYTSQHERYNLKNSMALMPIQFAPDFELEVECPSASAATGAEDQDDSRGNALLSRQSV